MYKTKKAHFAVNLALADWTGLEQAAVSASNTMSYRFINFGATELLPGERTGAKIPITFLIRKLIRGLLEPRKTPLIRRYFKKLGLLRFNYNWHNKVLMINWFIADYLQFTNFSGTCFCILSARSLIFL